MNLDNVERAYELQIIAGYLNHLLCDLPYERKSHGTELRTHAISLFHWSQKLKPMDERLDIAQLYNYRLPMPQELEDRPAEHRLLLPLCKESLIKEEWAIGSLYIYRYGTLMQRYAPFA